MNITLLQGHFSARDAEDLITQLVHVKIKYHENKIGSAGDNSEDIKMREKRIIQLQKDLFEMRKYIKQHPDKVNLHAEINL